MDRKTEKYYENYFEMFATPGWKQYVEELKEGEQRSYHSLVEGDDQNFFIIKGGILMLKKMAAFQGLIYEAYKAAQESEAEGEEAKETEQGDQEPLEH